MKKTLLLTSAVVAALLTGCGGVKPVITNTHEGVYEHTTAKEAPLEVRVDPRPLNPAKESPPPAKTFVDWPDSLKHIYLKAMAKRTTTPKELVEALQLPLAVEEKKPEAPRPTKFDEYKIVFEFANIKHYFRDKIYAHPDTRLEFLNTTLNINKGSYAYFYTIDKLQNEFEELDMGSLERTQNVNFNVKGNITGALGSGASTKNTNNTTDTNNSGNNQSAGAFDAAGNQTSVNGTTGGNQSTRQGTNETNASAEAKVTAGLEAAYANEQMLKEATAIKGKRMMLGFAVGPDQLTVSQRSRPISDISQNVFVTANLKFGNPDDSSNLVTNAEISYFSGLYNGDNQPVAAGKLGNSQRIVTYVDRALAKNISFIVGFEGELRAVGNESGKSGNNALEYDDHITYYYFKKDNSYTFKLDHNEFAKTAYQIKAQMNGRPAYLYIASPVRRILEVFSDDNPELFLQWLKDQLEQPVIANLQAKKFKLYFVDDRGNKIDMVKTTVSGSDLLALKGVSNLELDPVIPAPKTRKPTTKP
ncbi:hypothetical protein A0256_00190 [Mucilaginibacter sp. PAMC 26640]|nr:hypothetical protein A0256_00190 [Mucilaginibacter sp. PAMC 26640]